MSTNVFVCKMCKSDFEYHRKKRFCSSPCAKKSTRINCALWREDSDNQERVRQSKKRYLQRRKEAKLAQLMDQQSE